MISRMRRTSLFDTGTLLIFLAAMMWATDAPFRVSLLKDLSPQFVVLAEHFFNMLLVLPVLIAARSAIARLSGKEWAALGVIAVGGSALATFMFTQAFAYVNPSVAILLQKLQPIITITLASVFLKEKLKSGFWLWAVLAMAGAYCISFPNLVPQVYAGEQFNPNMTGVLLAVGAAALWGASTVFGKYLLHRIDFLHVTALRFGIAFLFLLVAGALTGHVREVADVTARDWLFLCIIAFVSGALSLYLYYRGLRTTKASVATIAELGFPLAAMLINALFLDEKLTYTQLAGAAVLLVSVWRIGVVNARGDDA